MSLRLTLLDQASRAWAAIPAGMRMRVLHATMPRFLVGVVGLIRDERGRVLLLEHRFRAPWPWGLPGGYIEHGEDLPSALARELSEELGLLLPVDPAVLDVELNQRGRYLSMTLGARAEAAAVFRLSDEILSAAWFEPAALPPGTYPYHAALVRRLTIAESDSLK